MAAADGRQADSEPLAEFHCSDAYARLLVPASNAGGCAHTLQQASQLFGAPSSLVCTFAYTLKHIICPFWITVAGVCDLQ
jgi:hypothetical protein